MWPFGYLFQGTKSCCSLVEIVDTSQSFFLLFIFYFYKFILLFSIPFYFSNHYYFIAFLILVCCFSSASQPLRACDTFFFMYTYWNFKLKFSIKHNACNNDISYEKRQKKSKCSNKLRSKDARYSLVYFCWLIYLLDYSVLFSEKLTISNEALVFRNVRYKNILNLPTFYHMPTGKF
jgi:hypothetical protein